MYKNILKIDFSRLRKLEARNLARRVITTVEGYNPETLKIKEIYDLLVELEPQIEFLDVGYGPHPISPNLSAMRKRRSAIGQGIVDQMKSLENGKMIGTEKDVEVAKRFVMRYLQGLWGKDEVTIYEKVALFSQNIKKDAELQEAFSSLNLTSYLDNLQSVNKAIEEQYSTRRKSISERPKKATPGIVSQLKTALQDLFKQIEVAQIKNKELDYTSLVDDLNEEIANYKAILKTRASYSKKKADGVIDNNEVVEDNGVVIENEPDESSSEPTQTTTRMHPMNVQVENGENLDHLDIKKTVAVPNKQTRLPNVSTEA